MKSTAWILWCLAIIAAPPLLAAKETGPMCFRLDNGLEVVLLEDHTTPVVASYFVVKTGLRDEDAATCGMSHMLEHLLFNGTETRTQEQLYRQADLLGAYNNAFTRDDYTCYMMVAPREHFARVLDLQADMLFHSVIPPEKLEKERGIVLEELAKDRTSPDEQAERLLQEFLFRGTPYALPVVGTETSIGAMSREQILRYYHGHYVPNNTVLLVVGDFEPAAARSTITGRLKVYPATPLPAVPPMPDITKEGRQATFTAGVPASRVVVSVTAPRPGAPLFHAFELARRYLEDEHASPLAELVKAGDIAQFGGEYQLNRDFALYRLTLEAKGSDPWEPAVVEELMGKIRRLKPELLSAEALKSYRIRLEVDEIYNYENIHYLGMLKGQLLAIGASADYGSFFGDRYLAPFQSVTAEQIQEWAVRLLGLTRPLVAILNAEAREPAMAPPPGMPGRPMPPRHEGGAR